MAELDLRLTPARSDLAALHLRGTVNAPLFVEGRRMQVSVPVLDLKRHPRRDAALDTQLLSGECLDVYDDSEGWAWVQAERDHYVGYVETSGIRDATVGATHVVSVARTFVYPAADMKRPVMEALPLGARIAVSATAGEFSTLVVGGFVFSAHVRPAEASDTLDAVVTAERLVGTPYLWGGRSPLGIDCSGLVQISFMMAGVALPRDAYMQERCGHAVADDGDLRRGDLVFWPGHVGVMTDSRELLHANAHRMLVSREPFAQAKSRIAEGKNGAPVRAVRRII